MPTGEIVIIQKVHRKFVVENRVYTDERPVSEIGADEVVNQRITFTEDGHLKDVTHTEIRP